MSATYILEVKADPSGLALLAKEFQGLEATIAATAKRAQAAIEGVGKGGGGATELAAMRAQLDGLTAGMRTLQAENELLTRKVADAARARKAVYDDEANAHVRAFQAAQAKLGTLQEKALAEDRARTAKKLAEQEQASYDYTEVVRRSFTREIALARAAGEQMTALRIQRAADNAKAALAERETESRVVQMQIADQVKLNSEMARLKQARVAADHAANLAEQEDTLASVNREIVARTRLEAELRRLKQARVVENHAMYQAEQADILKTINAEIAANVRAGRTRPGAGGAGAGGAAAARAEAEAVQELRSAYRGLAYGVDAAFLSYGKLLPLLAGFAVSAGIAQTIKLGADFQYQMAFVGAVSDETGEKLTRAGRAFQQMAEVSQFSTAEVARGARTLAQAGLSLNDSVAVMPQLLKFSTLGEIDLARGAEIAAGTMHAFQMSISDIPHILDSTVKAAQISQTTIDEMGSAMRQASTVGLQYNLSLDQMNALLAILAQRNIRGTAAGTSLRNMMQELDPATQKAQRAYKALGITITDSSGQYKDIIQLLGEFSNKFAEFDQASQNRLARDYFNERGAKAFLNAIREANGELPKFLDQIQNAGGTLDKQARKIDDTFAVQGKEALHTFQNAFIDAFQTIEPELTKAMKSLKEFAGSPEFKAGIESLASSFGILIETLKFVAQIAKDAKGAIDALNPDPTNRKSLTQGMLPPVVTPIAQGLQKGVGGWWDKHVYGNVFDWLDTERNGGQNQFERAMAAAEKQAKADIEVGKKAAQLSTDLRTFRQMEAANLANGGNQGYGKYAQPTPTAGGRVYNPMGQKEAEDAAKIAVQQEENRYRREQQMAKANYDAQLEIMRAYHNAGLTSDTDFNTREATLTSQYASQEEQALIAHVTALRAQRAILLADHKKTAEIDDAISKATDDLTNTQLKNQARAVADAAKEWSKFNRETQSVIDSTQKSNTELKNEIEALKAHTQGKKDSTMATLDARIVMEKETIARLEAEAATWDQCKALTAEQEAKLGEIDAAKKALEQMQKERVERKELVEEKKRLEGDWINGAIKGLQDYEDHGLSTAKVIETAFKDAFSSLEGVIMNFVIHGKANIKDFLNSVGQDILKMLIKLEITQPLAQVIQGWLSGSGVGGVGGIVGMVMSLLGGGGGGGGVGGAGSTVGGVGNAVSTLGTIGSFAQGLWTGTGSGIAGGAGAWLNGAYHGIAGAYNGFLYGQSGAVITDAYGAEATNIGATNGILGTGGTPYGAWATATPYLWILAGILKSASLYGSGWGRADSGDMGTDSLGRVNGGPVWSPAAFVVNRTDRFLRDIGLSDKWASILSGKPGIARLFGHSATHADAYGVMGSVNGQDLTGQNYQDFSQKGGFFSSDRRWQQYAPFESGQNDFFQNQMTGVNRVTGAIGDYYGVNSKDVLSNYHRDFSIQMSNNGDPISQDELNKAIGDFFGSVLQEQTQQIFHAGGDTKMEDYVKALTGTGDEITHEIVSIAQAASSLKNMNLKGLDLDALLAWKQGNEKLSDTFQRISSELGDFDNNFMSDAQKLSSGQALLKSGFDSLGLSIPKSKEEFYNLVHGLDLSTESGRHAFDVLMQLAPVFINVGNAADAAAQKTKQAIDNFNSAASALSPQYGQQYAQANLSSAVQAWMALNPANGAAGGWTEQSTIQNIAFLAQGGGGGFSAALQYAQSIGGDEGVTALTNLLNAYGAYNQALGQGTETVQQNTSAVSDFAQAVADAKTSLEDWAKSKLLSNDSPLTPAQKLDFALSDYAKAKAAAQSDPTKLGNYQSAADALLSQGRAYWSSSDEYTALFNRVMQDSQTLGGFTLDYHSNVAAASTDQMRQDLLAQMQLSYVQDQAMRADIQAITAAIESSSNAAVQAILESAADIKTSVVNAVSATTRN